MIIRLSPALVHQAIELPLTLVARAGLVLVGERLAAARGTARLLAAARDVEPRRVGRRGERRRGEQKQHQEDGGEEGLGAGAVPVEPNRRLVYT